MWGLCDLLGSDKKNPSAHPLGEGPARAKGFGAKGSLKATTNTQGDTTLYLGVPWTHRGTPTGALSLLKNRRRLLRLCFRGEIQRFWKRQRSRRTKPPTTGWRKKWKRGESPRGCRGFGGLACPPRGGQGLGRVPAASPAAAGSRPAGAGSALRIRPAPGSFYNTTCGEAGSWRECGIWERKK